MHIKKAHFGLFLVFIVSILRFIFSSHITFNITSIDDDNNNSLRKLSSDIIYLVPSDFRRLLINVCIPNKTSCHPFILSTKFPELRVFKEQISLFGINSDQLVYYPTEDEISVSLYISNIQIDKFVLEKFPFYILGDTKNYDTKKYSGILGLGFQYENTRENIYKEQMSVIDELYRSKQIDKRIFYIKMRNLNEGILGIGDYPIEKINNAKYRACRLYRYSEGLLKDAILNSQFECVMNGIYFTENENNYFMYAKRERVLINISSNVIFAKNDFFDFLKEKVFLNYINSKICKNRYIGKYEIIKCFTAKMDEEFLESKIAFIMEKWNFKLTISKLFYGSKAEKTFSIVRDSSSNVWKFGYPILIEYIAVFDKEKKEFGIIPKIDE